MKEKKGKKALEDFHSLKKRSTLLKELSDSVSFGTSIQTISNPFIYTTDLPPYYYTNNLSFCKLVGYYSTKSNIYVNLRYNGGKLKPLGKSYGPSQARGWHYWVNPAAEGTNAPSSFFNHPEYNFNNNYGHLFVFFTGIICDSCETLIAYDCKKMSENGQDTMFAVLIDNISQINALNKMFDSWPSNSYWSSMKQKIHSDSSIYLSNVLLDNLYNNLWQDTIDNVKKYLKYSVPNSPPLLRHDPVSPLMFATNVVINDFNCFQGAEINVKNSIILLPDVFNAFTVSDKRLSLIDFEKIPFYVERIEGEGSELVNRNTIKFLKSGTFTFTLFFEQQHFEDTENIFGNPTGPTTYGPKRFYLKINATVALALSLEFKVSTIQIDLLDGNINTIIDLKSLITYQNMNIENMNIENINTGNLQFKIEPILNVLRRRLDNVDYYDVSSSFSFNVSIDNRDNRFITILPSTGGCKLTVSYVDNNDKYSYSTSTSVNLFWTYPLFKFKVDVIAIELDGNGNINLESLLTDQNTTIKNINKNDLQYKLEDREGGKQLTVYYIGNNGYLYYSTSVNVLLNDKKLLLQ